MKNNHYLDDLLAGSLFRFADLSVQDIDNAPVFECFGRGIADQEICLFHRDVLDGNDYIKKFHETVARAITHREALPVVRFADGEYAFYNYDLSCNGLYHQAESANTIQQIMPVHIEAMKKLAAVGKFAPLVFPGNVGKKPEGIFSFFAKWKKESSAMTFLDFLSREGIALDGDNYLPFYIVYAYLSSDIFAQLLDKRKICILNSEYNQDACYRCFGNFSSCPEISFVEIPDSYIATRWPQIKESILSRIPLDTDLCLVGAGAGALLVCVDASHYISAPAIDAGHVLNMMNDRTDKSNGLRLYTLRKAKP